MAALSCSFWIVVAPARSEQPFVTFEGDPNAAAWRVIADFDPFTTKVRGIRVNQIRKTWCKATELRKELIPKELIVDDDVDAMEANKLSFAIEGHFVGCATKQAALVGVYQECAGQKGSCILILDQLAGGKSKVRLVNAVATDRQFGGLSRAKATASSPGHAWIATGPPS